MVYSIYRSAYVPFLIIIWFSLQLLYQATMDPQDKDKVPLPTNLKVDFYPGIINVSWDCNITESMKNYTYKIILQKKNVEILNITKGFFQYEVHLDNDFTLKNGVSINILTEKISSKTNNFNRAVENNWKEVIFTPKGKTHTAAEDFSCVIYNVSLMNCSWTVGKEAPEDVQYYMDIWQNNVRVKCQVYRKDSFGRHVGCFLNSPDIKFKHFVYAQVVGSSNQTSVQFMDEIIKPNDYVILDPPRNIQLSYNSSDLEITWEKPKTYRNEDEKCFTYNIYFKEKGGINITRNGKSFKTNQFNANEKVTAMMRVKWQKACSINTNWSRWSNSHTIGSDPWFVQNHLLVVLGIGTAVVLFFLTFLCHRFRLWTKLFPRVPKPAIKMLEEIDQKQIRVQKFSECEISCIKEDEEDCVYSDVTEILQKQLSESITEIRDK